MSNVMTLTYQNPHASEPMQIPCVVLCNTPDEVLSDNVRENTRRQLRWLRAEPETARVAVMVGGGPSVADHVDDIARLQATGAVVFAMNGASQWLRRNGIVPNYQVLCDAQPETAALVDPGARGHLIASQCHPRTMNTADDPILWHLETGAVEMSFHPNRPRQKGGYALIGGGAAVGNSAMCVAYAMGFRRFEVFGYDSSHRDGEGHAYKQAMNDRLGVFEVDWCGKIYHSTITMRAQAEKFQLTGQALKQAGCVITVHGDGLLPDMWRTPPAHMTEREKYRRMWQFETYRTTAPGEQEAAAFVDLVKPDSTVIDFGCGTGRGSLAIQRLSGCDVILVDFAENCRDEAALHLPFLEWDLTHPCPARAHYGYCTDVLEHIPPSDVEAVIRNVMASVGTAFFQISTVPDIMGGLIRQSLHLTVEPHAWWLALFQRLGFDVAYASDQGNASQFVIQKG